MKVKVFTDYACPFCYIGHELVEKVAKDIGVEIEYYFSEIHPEVPAEGCPTGDVVKGDLEKFNGHIASLAKQYGIRPQLGTKISNSKKAIILRGYILDKHPERIKEFDTAMYEAYLVKNYDIGSEDILQQILNDVGIDENIAIALNNTMANIKFEMDRSAAKENYVDSIPTFVANGKRLVGAVEPDELATFIKNA